jgi:hypothetical protein
MVKAGPSGQILFGGPGCKRQTGLHNTLCIRRRIWPALDAVEARYDKETRDDTSHRNGGFT